MYRCVQKWYEGVFDVCENEFVSRRGRRLKAGRSRWASLWAITLSDGWEGGRTPQIGRGGRGGAMLKSEKAQWIGGALRYYCH
jgi:hypothetical protein